MSLGVLNNLNAIYAENNLNNTSNSLNTVLQQLSSGSKINSGADDAAGLSLVDGLQANSMALQQSETNATEGVGLLTVADGALSQVTNLLNRAVTLATEASNGTLNGSQDTAANQEYQSILSEISNIGSTTTYNQESVFNSNTNIYTGDSSTTGASIDDLNIRSLSSANVGDSNGTMSYSNGQGNVFIDLSNGGVNAAVTDTLDAGSTGSGTSTIAVDYLVKGSNGVNSTATTNITVGGTTSYANTVQGMMKAIDNSGLGITASFTTAAAAGDSAAAATTDTGIEITGSVASGTTPSAASFSGTVKEIGDTSDASTLTGSIVITDGSGAAQQITVAQVAAGTETGHAQTLAGLVAYINDGSSGSTETDAFGVHASAANGVLTLTSATGADVGNHNALTVTSNLTDATATTPAMSYTANAAYNVGLNQGTNSSTASSETEIFDSTTGQVGGASSTAPTLQTDTGGSGGMPPSAIPMARARHSAAQISPTRATQKPPSQVSTQPLPRSRRRMATSARRSTPSMRSARYSILNRKT